MNRIKSMLRPSARLWGFTLAGLIGIFIGLGLFTVNYANGTAYLSNDPQACNNCHIMREQFDAWQHSSHARIATCNDCHTPHNSIIAKWFVKGVNGLNHSVAFTLGNFDEPIHSRQFNSDIAQQNCITCHAEIVQNVLGIHADETPRCTFCHGNVGHATRGS